MADITVALSENAIKRVFAKKVETNPSIDKAGSKSFPFGRIAYHIRFHLANSPDTRIDLETNANTPEGKKDIVRVRELDIIWEKLYLEFNIRIPTRCIGGGCVDLPWPLPDFCWPEKCFFEDETDLSFALDLPSAAINSEVSGSFVPNTIRVPGAPDSGEWQIRLHAMSPFDVDVFDPADLLGRLFHEAFRRVVDGVLGPLPDWAKDLLWMLIGNPIEWILRNVLDIGDDIQEWFQRIIGHELGLINFIAGIVARQLDDFVLHKMDDPYKIIDAEGQDGEVRISISNIGVVVASDELILNLDIKSP